MQNLRYKYHSKEILTRDSGNVQFHDPEVNKFYSTTNVNSGVHTLAHNIIIAKPIQ